MTQLRELELTTIAGGVAPELFRREMDQVLANIDDPNTEASAVRTIKLTMKFKPDANRSLCICTIEAQSKLASVLHATGSVYFGRTNGKLRGYTQDVNQLGLKFETTPTIVKSENKEVKNVR